jgi:hypothetical protein
LGLILDYTDDRLDPRDGLRFEASGGWLHGGDRLQGDWVTMDYNLTGYRPARRWDTRHGVHPVHQLSVEHVLGRQSALIVARVVHSLTTRLRPVLLARNSACAARF